LLSRKGGCVNKTADPAQMCCCRPPVVQDLTLLNTRTASRRR